MDATVLRAPLKNVKAEDLIEWQKQYPKADLIVSLHDEMPTMGMDEDRFWQLIGLLDWSKEGDDKAVVEPIVEILTHSSFTDIYGFHDQLSAKLFALDQQLFATQIGEDAYKPDAFFSVDNFLYARACAVANGRNFYESVLTNPTLMPKDLTFEALIHIASDAYRRKTGNHFEYFPVYNIETYSNEAGWPV
ncbi:MAG: DUF4240 domain-containing protein [Saprospiraceae bacterium]